MYLNSSLYRSLKLSPKSDLMESVKDLEYLKKIKAGSPEDGLLGAVGMAPELEELAEKTMEGYQRRADEFGKKNRKTEY